MKDISPDHLDLGLVLSLLVHLEEFSIYYGFRNCGINFKWEYFGMTIQDSIRLANAIQASSLTHLSIPASGIDDDRCKVLCAALLKNRTITLLDISNNKIKNQGARSIATVLASSTAQLSVLKLGNNKLGPGSGLCLGKALEVNTSLKHLDLRLNRLSDEGGCDLFNNLKNNTTLSVLDISGNYLGSKSVPSLAALLKRNDPTLSLIDVSCNKLGTFVPPITDKNEQTLNVVTNAPASAPDISGKAILEAISLNKVN
jgi:hypothetical protein